jgi:hypothetical protein
MANLALSAATFDNEEPKNTGILQKRKNRTHKNMNNMTDKSYYSNKVNDVLSKIHNQIYSEGLEDMDDTYGNFEPISRPTPMKTGKKELEEFSQMTSNPQNVLSQMDNVPSYKATKYEELSQQSLNPILIQSPNSQYPYPDYEKHIQSNPNSYYRRADNTTTSPSTQKITLDAFPMVNDISYNGYDKNNKLLMEKLNYMIHLLEETHDEQTNNVLEEVILYSFLGIFIIFLIDNFIKVGRYVR